MSSYFYSTDDKINPPPTSSAEDTNGSSNASQVTSVSMDIPLQPPQDMHAENASYDKQCELNRAIEVMQVWVALERELGHPAAEEDAARVEEIRTRLSAKDI